VFVGGEEGKRGGSDASHTAQSRKQKLVRSRVDARRVKKGTR